MRAQGCCGRALRLPSVSFCACTSAAAPCMWRPHACDRLPRPLHPPAGTPWGCSCSHAWQPWLGGTNRRLDRCRPQVRPLGLQARQLGRARRGIAGGWNCSCMPLPFAGCALQAAACGLSSGQPLSATAAVPPCAAAELAAQQQQLMAAASAAVLEGRTCLGSSSYSSIDGSLDGSRIDGSFDGGAGSGGVLNNAVAVDGPLLESQQGTPLWRDAGTAGRSR